MNPVVTESGRFIAYYTLEEARRLFGDSMRIEQPQFIVKDEAAKDMSTENGWRYLKNTDGTYSLWNNEAFEHEFGVKFDSTIRCREDIRWARKRQLQTRFQQLVTGLESPSWNDLERDSILNRPIPDQEGRGSKGDRGHDPEQSVRQPVSANPKSRQPDINKLEALEERLRKYEERRAEMERERQEFLASRREQKAREGIADRREEPQVETALATKKKHKQNNQAESTKRHKRWAEPIKGEWKVVRSQGELQEAHKRESKLKRQREREREKELKRLLRKNLSKKPAAAPKNKEHRSTNPSGRKPSTDNPRLSDDEIFSIAMKEHGEETCAQVKALLKRKTMEEAILRVMTIAGLQPGIDLPKGFSLDANTQRVKNYYCRSNSIRIFCLNFLAELIERAGNTSSSYGTEPLTWALNHCEDGSRLKRSAARQILAERDHTLVFSSSCIDEATSCEEPLTYIPFRTTLVRIPGHEGASWGVVAMQDEDEISLISIGDEDLTDIARNMLAYVENLCTPHTRSDGATNYRRMGARKGGAPYGSVAQSGERVHRITRGHISSTSSTTGNAYHGGSISAPYTRRAHTRRQHYGAGNRLVKIITIKETLVMGRCKDTGKLPKGMRVHRVG